MWCVPVCAVLILCSHHIRSHRSYVVVGKNLLGITVRDRRKMENNVYHMLHLYKKKKKAMCMCVHMCVYGFFSHYQNFFSY